MCLYSHNYTNCYSSRCLGMFHFNQMMNPSCLTDVRLFVELKPLHGHFQMIWEILNLHCSLCRCLYFDQLYISLKYYWSITVISLKIIFSCNLTHCKCSTHLDSLNTADPLVWLSKFNTPKIRSLTKSISVKKVRDKVSASVWAKKNNQIYHIVEHFLITFICSVF